MRKGPASTETPDAIVVFGRLFNLPGSDLTAVAVWEASFASTAKPSVKFKSVGESTAKRATRKHRDRAYVRSDDLKDLRAALSSSPPEVTKAEATADERGGKGSPGNGHVRLRNHAPQSS